jgi:hypothetical protein
LNATKNCTNQKTKRTIISTTRKNENEAKEMIVLNVKNAKKLALNSMRE